MESCPINSNGQGTETGEFNYESGDSLQQSLEDSLLTVLTPALSNQRTLVQKTKILSEARFKLFLMPVVIKYP